MSEENTSESNLNKAVHTAVEELTDEQKALITASWDALSETERETYAEFSPVTASGEGEAKPEATPAA